MLSRNFLAAAHDLYDAPVVDEDFMRHSALAAEVQHCAAVANEADVAVAKRREAEALVVPGVFGITHPDPRGIEQGDHDGKNFFSRQARQRQIATEEIAQLRQ